MQRAAAVRSDFAANGEVAEICRRLDCLPLAIELAAARVKALSLPVLLERLEQRLPLLAGGSRSAPERQRTLRATIAWSHDLLTAAEQGLFARLAVFAGGCTLEAAEEICGADLDAIASLVDKSLLRRSGDRYWMLETIREFASEQLDQLADVGKLRDRHAAFYVALGERARPELRARGAREWLERLDAEHANVWATLEHLLESGDADGALRLSGAIWLYWQTRGHWTEGRRYLTAAIALGADLEPERLSTHCGAADSSRCGRATPTKASSWRPASSRSRRQRRNRSMCIRWRSTCLRSSRPDGVIATRRSRCSRSRWRSAVGGGDQWLLSIALNNLGDLLTGEGDYERAAELFEESLAIGEARGDLDRRARALTNLGWATHGLGDLARARDFYRRGLEAATEIGLVEVPAPSAVRHRRAWKPRPATPARELVYSAE